MYVSARRGSRFWCSHFARREHAAQSRPARMAESSSDFKAFVLDELAVLHRGLAEHARATKIRKTELDAESTNSGASSALSCRSSNSEEEIFATPLTEQPPKSVPYWRRRWRW